MLEIFNHSSSLGNDDAQLWGYAYVGIEHLLSYHKTLKVLAFTVPLVPFSRLYSLSSPCLSVAASVFEGATPWASVRQFFIWSNYVHLYNRGVFRKEQCWLTSHMHLFS